MGTITGFFRLFYMNSALRLSRAMQYRVDFMVGIVISFGYATVTPLIQPIPRASTLPTS